MNIIIAGDGEVGFHLARSLTDLDHNITVVDPNSELLKRLEKDHGSQLKFLSVCLDADKKECRKNMDRDSIKWHNICDGRMWETPILGQLGLYFVPDNIITDSKGKILAHSIATNQLDKKIEELLK